MRHTFLNISSKLIKFFFFIYQGWGPEGYTLALVSAEEESGAAGKIDKTLN